MTAKRVTSRQAAVRDDIRDLVTRRALPTEAVGPLDPFLFLNHHGPQVYPPRNQGLPFGPHPHRGFETVTFILKGDIAHHDTGGHASVIGAGGIQWMTAGRGLVHSEVSSDDFKRDGGPLEILQLWLNLPARLKMTEPRYVGVQADGMPVVTEDRGRVRLRLAAGAWRGTKGAVEPLTDVTLMVVELDAGGRVELPVPAGHTVFFYVVAGAVEVSGDAAAAFQLVELSEEGEKVAVTSGSGATVLFGHAAPYGEPIAMHGPFVMNTREEILEAIQDYQSGKLR